jgi:hypothetical protein
MPSPACEVKEGAGAYAVTTDGVNVTPAATIVIHLIDPSANSWDISCATTDDLSDASDVNAALAIDPIANTATFTAPVAGRVYRFRSRVNGGIGPNGRAVSSYTTTFCVYTLTAAGARCVAADESTEGNSGFGWIAAINAFLRASLGVPDDLAAGDLLYYDGSELVRIAADGVTDGSILTMTGGVPGWVAASEIVDIDTLAFNLAVRGSYAGSPWSGFATTGGDSDLYKLVTLFDAPDVGTALNTYDTADFDPASLEALRAQDIAGSTDIFWDAVVSASAYYGFAVLTLRDAAAAAGNIYDNALLVGDNGGSSGVAFSSSGVAAFHTDGGGVKATGWKAVTLDTPTLIEWWYDGTDLHIAVDGVEGTSVAAGSATGLGTSKFDVGRNNGATAFADMLLAELRVAPTDLSANSASVLAYVNDRYGLAL